VLPHKHLIISTMIGAVGWWGTGEPAAGAVALIAGVLPDVDHIVDYAYYQWWREHRLIVPLHGYEYAALGSGIALLTGDTLLGIAVLSYLIHLLADQTENRTHILGYSLLFRVWNRFRMEKLSTVPEAAMRGRMDDMNSIKKLLRRWQK
jgi:hypothetical protein